MPPRNEDIRLESPSLFSPKDNKKFLVITVASLFFVILTLSTALFLTYQSKRKAAREKERESVLGAETTRQNPEIPAPTSTPSPTPSPVPSPSPSPTPKTNISPSTKKLKYTYDMLEINFMYPDNWKVETTKVNVKGSGFRFNCKDKVTTDMFIRDPEKCVRDEIEPENLIITGPNDERIVFWNIDKVSGNCPLNADFKIIILGKLKTFTPVMTNGLVSPCYGIVFEPGGKSNWKSYRIDFSSTPVQYDTVEEILQSIQYN